MEDNHNSESWSTYSRLVLKELERLNDELVECKKESARLNNLISLLQQEVNQHNQTDDRNFTAVKQETKDIRDEFLNYLKEVNEVWSPKQMQQVKNEVYNQKNHMAKVAGVVITIQVIIGILLTFKEQIFGH